MVRAPGNNEVVLELRPNTKPPTQVPMLSISKEQIRSMSSQELAQFALDQLGIPLDPNMKKTEMVSKLLSLATMVETYQ
jgi:hypothetical protein